MNLLKTSFLSAIETLIKLASGFVVIKYIAIEVGPEGVAYFGQFQNFLAAFIILISGSASTGLVCFSAQEKVQNQKPVYLGNTLGMGIIICTILGAILCIFSQELSFLIFKTTNYSLVFCFLAIVSIFIVLFQAIIAQLNGLDELVKLLTCKGTSSLVLLLSSLVFVYRYGLMGGLIALVCMQSISALMAILLLKRVNEFQWSWLIPKFDFLRYKDLSGYWFTSFVTVISTPLVLISIRMDIVNNLGWQAAGIWESSWKIAELYLLVITTGLTTYYVPKISKSQTFAEELITIKKVLLLGLCCASVLAVGVYLFRSFIVTLLFSQEFAGATQILEYQLIGSVIKIASWIFAYHMLVKRKIALFLISELFFGGTFYWISKICLQNFGLVGLSYAYCINYCLYLIFCVCYISNIYRTQSSIARLTVCPL